MNVSRVSAFRSVISRAIRVTALASLHLLGSVAGTSAQLINVNLDEPSIDKNGYPFSPNGGGPRTSAFTFGAIGSVGFDDRDAQFFNRFATSGIVPTGRGAANYQILSATLTLSIFVGDGLVFDGSYDPISTYDAGGNPINGDDPGRPLELYGAAYRNGITRELVTENLAYGAPGDGTRNIYATDFLLGASLNGTNRDVSNNIAQAFDPSPFAIGQVAPADLNPNGTVKDDAEVVFTLNLANPDVLRYLQLSLDAGSIDLVATSLHLAEQGGDVAYAEYYTKENLVDGLPGRLDLQVMVVPEPGAVTLLLCAFGVLVGFWRGRQALQKGEGNL
jgi:hypothetical protein